MQICLSNIMRRDQVRMLSVQNILLPPILRVYHIMLLAVLHIIAKLDTMQKADDIAELALAYGVDVNATNSANQTALHLAIENEHTLLFWLLLDVGCDVNLKDNQGNTPFHIAASMNNFEYVEQLLDAGADTTLKNEKNQTARQEATDDYIRTVIDEFEAKAARDSKRNTP